ncbi:HD domain-containing protein [Clostridium thermarum]|uniref:HD domain-containing protein n=1 Tax=Clostridium thermarum TaxID=1716543 RepID=UPI00193F177C|nr:HD domain-containing protein [Clostridium thermarum]
MKRLYVKDIKDGTKVNDSFMVMKKLDFDGENVTVFLGDRTGEIKALVCNKSNSIKVGDVITIKGVKGGILKASEFKFEQNFKCDEYLPAISRPIDEIISELEQISEEEFKTLETKSLNDYFFKNPEFVEKFKKGIGGLSQHHNYRGGLAEHTLNVTYLTKILAYRYDCRFKEIAILAAKLHDIGKIEEYEIEGPFKVSMRGEMEGHIVIGMNMIEEAFKAGKDIYSEDFKNRLRGCIVQHHGKVEYGSPKAPNTEEAYMVHYADYVDATMNKIGQIKDLTEPDNWSDYDRRIGTKLYV